MDNRKNIVAAARGDRPFDLAITDVKLLNVLTGTVDHVDIGIVGNRIAALLSPGSIDEARRVIDGKGLHACPGFVDGHVHNESSMVTPARWAETIVPMGTTTVFTDPHEIGNVLGLEGVRYMLDASAGIPMRYFVTAPSCVPAVPSIETSGATLTHTEMTEMLSWERVVAVAEAMDYPGLIEQRGNITPIVEVGHRARVPIEGHAPGVTGRLLQAYLAAAGPRASDHENYSALEMVEKAKMGMQVYVRTSTFLDASPVIAQALDKVKDARMFAACTDDIMPNHLFAHGHLDRLLRSLIAQGVDAITAYQMATVNVAEHYGMWGLGAVAPGWLADLLILDDVKTVQVRHVIVNGKLVVYDGKLAHEIKEPIAPLTKNTMDLPALTVDSFRLSAADSATTFHAMDMSELFTKLTTIQLISGNGEHHLPESVSLAAIVPRHGQGTPPSLVPIVGYPLKRGAIASTVSHDSHNLAVIGTNAHDMLVAAQSLAECGGGVVSVLSGATLARAELPIAGLMSPLPVAKIGEKVTHWANSMPDLGMPPGFPLGLLALALPVIPEVRLTDRGLVDVGSQTFIPLTV